MLPRSTQTLRIYIQTPINTRLKCMYIFITHQEKEYVFKYSGTGDQASCQKVNHLMHVFINKGLVYFQ